MHSIDFIAYVCYNNKTVASQDSGKQNDAGVWHSRGRLPHFDQPGSVQAVTFRLADSLPEVELRRLETAYHKEKDPLRCRQIEDYLDQGHGSCVLRDSRWAKLVEDSMLYFDRQRYELLAWVVMPNHVHLILHLSKNYGMPAIMQTMKGFTANAINKATGRYGRFWQPEYYDRMIRDDEHLRRAITYFHYNPVIAKLVSRPEDWPWSSASKQRSHPLPAK